MEEYRDLDLTVTAFREVLDEPEFLPLSAGIVLQAYLPDSHRVQRALTAWAHRAPEPRRRADQAAHRQGREPRHGAHRGRRAWLAPGALRDEGRGRRQLQAHARVRLPARARGGRAPGGRQPQPLRHRLRARAARGPRRPAVGRVRDAGGHGQPPGTGGARARRRSLALRARGQGRGLPQRHRLPRPAARREHGARELPAPRVRPRAWLAGMDHASAIDSWPPSSIKAALSDAPRRTQDRSTERDAQPVPRPLHARFENDPDTDWTLAAEPRVDRGRRGAAGASARRRPSRSQVDGGVPRRARERRKAATPRGPAASPIVTRWGAPRTSTARWPSPGLRSRRGPRIRPRSARPGSRRARPSWTGAAATSSAR